MKRVIMVCIMLVISFMMIGCKQQISEKELQKSNNVINMPEKVVEDANSDNIINIPEKVVEDVNSDNIINIPEKVVEDANSDNIINIPEKVVEDINIANNKLILNIMNIGIYNENSMKNKLQDEFLKVGIELEQIEWLNKDLFIKENDNKNYIKVFCITFKNSANLHMNEIKNKIMLFDFVVDVYDVIFYEVPYINLEENEKISLK